MKKSFSEFFIDRPIFSAVISIAIVLLGFIGFFRLPISQYPDIVPPTIAIDAAYPGASPEILMENVATPIEQEVNGVEGMMYMTSRSNSDGTVSIEVAFELGTNINAAQVLVQNRVEVAKPRLPEEVRAIGVRVSKRSPSLLLGLALYSPDGSRDTTYLTNYYLTQIRDKILRIDGVGDVVAYGEREFSIRVWLDPDRLADFNMSPLEVVAAIREQNRQVAAGKLNQAPVSTLDEPYELLLRTKGRLGSESEFGDIIVRSLNGKIVRLKDVARVELGAYSYSNKAFYKGGDAVAFLVYQSPGSNASNTAGEVLKLFEGLRKDFPAGVDYDVGMDNTVYIADSIMAVFRTILEATALVVFVMVLFLQKWRAAIIPLFAIPISLMGTFFFMALFGFTINNLTLFGMVLAIGIVVDDAIVVVENVERNMGEGETDAKLATKKAMRQVQNALIAVVLALVSVFVPTAFVSGIAGEFYRQFALTIAASTLISGVVSLTLTPALAAIFFRPSNSAWAGAKLWDFIFGRLFSAFNAGFKRISDLYGGAVGRFAKMSVFFAAAYVVLIIATLLIFRNAPKGFIPGQDTCYFYVAVQLPEGSSLERTAEVMRRAEKTVAKTLPEALKYMSLAGLNIADLGRTSNSGTMFIQLKSKEERLRDGIVLDDSINRLMGAFYREIPEAMFFAVKPPVVSGIGFGGDYKCYVQDKSDLGLGALDKYTKEMVEKTRAEKSAASALTMFGINNPELYVDIDREQAERMGVRIGDIFDAMRFNMGSVYINDFNMLNRAYRVQVQADLGKRSEISDILRLRVPVAGGGSTPIGGFASVDRTVGPQMITRYNLYPSAELVGNVKAGHSTGEVMNAVEKISGEILPDGMDIEWTDLAFQEKRSSNTSMLVFALSSVFVFLVLAATYESWGLPLSVILIVPLVLLFSILGVRFSGMDINVMTQVGFIVLIGLACKNAILIVEFARQRQERGEDVVSAVAGAARNRLRPIIMTSLAFILGVFPLVYATGTGAELRNALGVPVFYGMMGVTAAGLFFTPAFFYFIRKNFHCATMKEM